MAGSSRLDHDPESEATDRPSGPDNVVTACETRPGRVVFLESGNTNGWIATDHVVVPEE